MGGWHQGAACFRVVALHRSAAERCAALSWLDIADGLIRIVQQKTGAKLWIPIHAQLRAVLAAQPKEHVSILVTE